MSTIFMGFHLLPAEFAFPSALPCKRKFLAPGHQLLVLQSSTRWSKGRKVRLRTADRVFSAWLARWGMATLAAIFLRLSAGGCGLLFDHAESKTVEPALFSGWTQHIKIDGIELPVFHENRGQRKLDCEGLIALLRREKTFAQNLSVFQKRP